MQIDMTNEERDILIRWKKRSDTLQAGENEGGGDCVRRPRRRPGYCRGDGRAGRGDSAQVAVAVAEEKAAVRGDRACRGRERGEAQAGAEGGGFQQAALGVGSQGRALGRPRLIEDVASDQVRRPVQVGLLLTCCSCVFWV